jgi:hypothetical protein
VHCLRGKEPCSGRLGLGRCGLVGLGPGGSGQGCRLGSVGAPF